MLLANGHLIVLTEDGDLGARPRQPGAARGDRALPRARREKRGIMPAIAGGYLLDRNLAEMAAFDLRDR